LWRAYALATKAYASGVPYRPCEAPGGRFFLTIVLNKRVGLCSDRRNNKTKERLRSALDDLIISLRDLSRKVGKAKRPDCGSRGASFASG